MDAEVLNAQDNDLGKPSTQELPPAHMTQLHACQWIYDQSWQGTR